MKATIGTTAFEAMLQDFGMTMTDQVVNELAVAQGWNPSFLVLPQSRQAKAKAKAKAAAVAVGHSGNVGQMLSGHLSSVPIPAPSAPAVPAEVPSAVPAPVPAPVPPELSSAPSPTPVAESSGSMADAAPGSSADPSAELCSICHEPMTSSSGELETLQCGHVLHAQCLGRWRVIQRIEDRRVCPMRCHMAGSSSDAPPAPIVDDAAGDDGGDEFEIM